MSDQEPEVNETQAPELPESPELAEPSASRRRPLPLVIAWALAPAVLMILAGLCMELGPDDVLPTIFLLIGTLGGIPTLFAWSIWMVYPANWTTPAKVVAVFPIAIVMCAVNLFLAFGACAVIEPPFPPMH